MSEQVLKQRVLDKLKEFKKGEEIENPYFEACWSKKGKWADLPEEGKCNECRQKHTASFKECTKGEKIWVYPTREEIEARAVVLALELSQAEIEKAFKDVSNAIERISKQPNTKATYSAGQRCVVLALKERLSLAAKKEARK